VFSEFGRRVRDNGKELIGTAAQCSSLVETTKEKIIGRNPDLADLDQGDLKHDIDLEVYMLRF
jgi:hypothetical protein